ncbi:MAG: hypothetical protein ACX94B_13050 [Henriciella sp.]
MKKNTDKPILAEQQAYEAQLELLRENWRALTAQLAGMNETLLSVREALPSSTPKPN